MDEHLSKTGRMSIKRAAAQTSGESQEVFHSRLLGSTLNCYVKIS